MKQRSAMPSILYVTDLYYSAQGREYFKEDLYITSKLKEQFEVLICHPSHALSFVNKTDLLVFRNAGPVIYFQEEFNALKSSILQKGVLSFNSFDGKGDMLGKNYLLDLTHQKQPVIPTIEKLDDIELLGVTDQYVVKPRIGADSIGMKIMDRHQLKTEDLEGIIVQPFLDFEYEVSFFYLNDEFQYALYAPNKSKRWQLKIYKPDQSDLNFAETFIRWNNMKCGIQRVDACRMKSGELLLVEMEDLNPYLSIDLLPEVKREVFIQNFNNALLGMLN